MAVQYIHGTEVEKEIPAQSAPEPYVWKRVIDNTNLRLEHEQRGRHKG